MGIYQIIRINVSNPEQDKHGFQKAGPAKTSNMRVNMWLILKAIDMARMAKLFLVYGKGFVSESYEPMVKLQPFFRIQNNHIRKAERRNEY